MKVSWLAARTTRTFYGLVRLPSPLLHVRDKRDNFCATIPTPSEHFPVQSDPGTSTFLMALGLALRRDFMAILRLNRLAYLLKVVSDLPDDYTSDRAFAAPFAAPRRE